MEAAQRWNGMLAIGMALACVCVTKPLAAQNARTKNFLVHAPNDPALASAIAKHAERFRDELAVHWLGRRLPDWPTPCPIEVVAGPRLAAQGATTYTRSPVGNFQMRVVGTPERILDSVLPHEVTHTVMATHFGRPLPRWADEGICTTVEHAAERNKHEIKLREYLSNRRGIAMNRLFLLTEYPSDMLPMYAQGYSVCRFLIEQSGPRQFIAFLEGYMNSRSWTENVRTHYGYESLRQLQDNWLAWVAAGSGSVDSYLAGGVQMATASATEPAATAPTIQPPANSLVAAASATSSPDSGSWYLRRLHGDSSAKTASENRPSPAEVPRATSPLASSPGGSAIASGAFTPIDQGVNARAEASDSRAGGPIGPPSVISSGIYSAAQPQSEVDFGQARPVGVSTRQRNGMYR